MATSAELGEALDVHPVELRRVLAPLRSEGIVESRRGAKGGWAIARDPARITLAAVLDALASEADVSPRWPWTMRCSPRTGRIAGRSRASPWRRYWAEPDW